MPTSITDEARIFWKDVKHTVVFNVILTCLIITFGHHILIEPIREKKWITDIIRNDFQNNDQMLLGVWIFLVILIFVVIVATLVSYITGWVLYIGVAFFNTNYFQKIIKNFKAKILKNRIQKLSTSKNWLYTIFEDIFFSSRFHYGISIGLLYSFSYTLIYFCVYIKHYLDISSNNITYSVITLLSAISLINIILAILLGNLSERSKGYPQAMLRTSFVLFVETLLVNGTAIGFVLIVNYITPKNLEKDISFLSSLLTTIIVAMISCLYVGLNLFFERYSKINLALEKVLSNSIFELRDHKLIIGGKNVGIALLNHIVAFETLNKNRKKYKFSHKHSNSKKSVQGRKYAKNKIKAFFNNLLFKGKVIIENLMRLIVVPFEIIFFLILEPLCVILTKTVYLSKYGRSKRKILKNIVVVEKDPTNIHIVGTYEGIQYGYIDYPNQSIIVPVIVGDVDDNTVLELANIELANHIFQTADSLEVGEKILSYIYSTVFTTHEKNYKKDIIIRCSRAANLKAIKELQKQNINDVEKWMKKSRSSLKIQLSILMYPILDTESTSSHFAMKFSLVNQLQIKRNKKGYMKCESNRKINSHIFPMISHNNTKFCSFLSWKLLSSPANFVDNDFYGIFPTFLVTFSDGFPKYLNESGVLKSLAKSISVCNLKYIGKYYIFTRKSSMYQSIKTNGAKFDNFNYQIFYTKDLIKDNLLDLNRWQHFYEKGFCVNYKNNLVNFRPGELMCIISNGESYVYNSNVVRLESIIKRLNKNHHVIPMFYTKTQFEYENLNKVVINSPVLKKLPISDLSLLLMSESGYISRQMFTAYLALLTRDYERLEEVYKYLCIMGDGTILGKDEAKKIRIEYIDSYHCGHCYLLKGKMKNKSQMAYINVWISLPKRNNKQFEIEYLPNCDWSAYCRIESKIPEKQKTTLEQGDLINFQFCVDGSDKGVLFTLLKFLLKVYNINNSKKNLESYYVSFKEDLFNLSFVRMAGCHYSIDAKYLEMMINKTNDNDVKVFEKIKTQKSEKLEQFIDRLIKISAEEEGQNRKNTKKLVRFLEDHIYKAVANKIKGAYIDTYYYTRQDVKNVLCSNGLCFGPIYAQDFVFNKNVRKLQIGDIRNLCPLNLSFVLNKRKKGHRDKENLIEFLNEMLKQEEQVSLSYKKKFKTLRYYYWNFLKSRSKTLKHYYSGLLKKRHKSIKRCKQF